MEHQRRKNMDTNQTKTNMTNKSSKLIAILMLICIMISSMYLRMYANG